MRVGVAAEGAFVASGDEAIEASVAAAGVPVVEDAAAAEIEDPADAPPGLPATAPAGRGRPSSLTVELPGGGTARAGCPGAVGLLAALLRELRKSK